MDASLDRPLSPEQRAWLLALARSSATGELGGPKTTIEPPADPSLTRKGACFTTFKRRDATEPGRGLRGCLGTLRAEEPLWKCVARIAADTVSGDPRFAGNPVTLGELPELKIDISVLHPLRELSDPLAFNLGEDGIDVVGQGIYDGRRGVFLPQVATEHHLTKEQLLTLCCEEKAGLPGDAWRDPAKCKVLAFRAEVFSEE
ncbi:MAG: AmmeMemoRadiSam system protein A [Planctomycetes bacterium]|nr:AmmeMemoRadiSam system protein A [Planctomycetota bacterium]